MSSRVRKLAEIAEVAAGAPVLSEGAADASIVLPRDVGSVLPAIGLLKRGPVGGGGRRERATLRIGDIVVVAKGPAPRAAVVGPATVGAVASSNLLVVRPRVEVVVPSALVAFLRTPAGQRQLLSAQTGSTLPSLSAAALGRVEVPIQDLKVQQRLALFVEAADEVLVAEQRALDLRRAVIARIAERVLAGESLDDLVGLELA